MISGELLSILQLTVVVALAATLAMLPPGVALAWWLARSRSWMKAPVETLVNTSATAQRTLMQKRLRRTAKPSPDHAGPRGV